MAYPNGSIFLMHATITVDVPSQWAATLTMVVQGPWFLATYGATISMGSSVASVYMAEHRNS